MAQLDETVRRANRPRPPARFEIAQVRWSVVEKKAFSGNLYQFWAEAIGPKGLYRAGTSTAFSGILGRTRTSPNAYYQEYMTRQ